MTPLRICIDARIPGGTFGGVEQVVIGIAAGLSKLTDGDEEYLFLTNPDHDGWLRPYLGGSCRVLHTRMEYPGQRGLARARRAVVERLPPSGLRRAVMRTDGTVERARVDVMHFAVQEAFLTEIPSIYQPHDLQHLHLPELFSRRTRRRRELVYRTHSERAEMVVAMTSWGKQDLVDHYGLDPEKVAVVPWGSVLWEYPEPSDRDLAELRVRLGFGEPFLLYPSQTWPHKNHARLLEALALVRRRDGLAIPLVCPGTRTKEYGTLDALIDRLELRETTRFPGFVAPIELRGMYALGRGLLFPSRFEGWGLPVCEAFSAALPVGCSAVAGLPDLVGDAGLLFDPEDTDQIADTAMRLWTDQPLRERLAELGRRRAEEFSFDRTARLFRAHYRRIAGAGLTEEDRILLASPPPT